MSLATSPRVAGTSLPQPKVLLPLRLVERLGGASNRIVDDDVSAFPKRCPELITRDPALGASDPEVLARVAA